MIRFVRRFHWMVRNWRYRWSSFAEEGVYVLVIGQDVRGMHVAGPLADQLRSDVDSMYAGRQWDSAHGEWVEG